MNLQLYIYIDVTNWKNKYKEKKFSFFSNEKNFLAKIKDSNEPYI